jgi:hypothetical protein
MTTYLPLSALTGRVGVWAIRDESLLRRSAGDRRIFAAARMEGAGFAYQTV